ncbi:condensation domain-containing protein [Hoyosella subflava]|uniref:Putative non-ribosomal peptide synthetase n=1 Tax=Hoyosella subflava (strain DSM 45089 / JCM 17490 / NBRC 109087 / DQS3-9A1) TaxID=443218 RepID=F6EKU6_HOYSD|nr:condensation domain-containing protein [Hoyosella subflava]AEF41426.1 Putative non-ribosomal peptide synthetase [Hoyosella subflava DQS3-9A1]
MNRFDGDSGRSGVRTPLTSAQVAIWFSQRLHPEVPDNLVHYVDLSGDVDEVRLAHAIRGAARETGISTVGFIESDGWPYQVARPSSEVEVQIVDLRKLPDPYVAAQRWMNADRTRLVDIVRDDLVTAAVLRIGDDRVLWYSRVHHLVADPFVVAALLRRASEIYSADNRDEAPIPSAWSAAHSAVDAEYDYCGSAAYKRDSEYWTEQLHDVAEPVSLAGRSAEPSLDTVRIQGAVPASINARIAYRSEQLGTTIAIVVAAAFTAYQVRATTSDDPLVSLQVAARPTMLLRRSPGVLSNVIPLRSRITASTPVRSAIRAVAEATIGALSHQRYRRDDIIRELGIVSDSAGDFGPVLNFALNESTVDVGGTRFDVHELAGGLVNDLKVTLRSDANDNLIIEFEANPHLYSVAEVESHHARFCAFLEQFITAADFTHIGALRGFGPNLQLVR